MYAHLKALKAATPPTTDDNDDDEEEQSTTEAEEMPSNYFFPGFVSFVLFGVFGPDDHKSVLMMTKDCCFGEKVSSGRAAACQAASEERSVRRGSGTTVEGTVNAQRGVSVSQTREASREAANMALTSDLVNNGIIGNQIMAISQSGQFKRDRITMLMKQQERYNPDSTIFQSLQVKIDRLDDELEVVGNQLDGLAAQSKRKHEDVVERFYSTSDNRQIARRSGNMAADEGGRGSWGSNTSSPLPSPDLLTTRLGSTTPPNVFSPTGSDVFSPVARMPVAQYPDGYVPNSERNI